MATSSLRSDANEIAKTVQGNILKNRHLQNICQAAGLPRAGVKAELQRRIINYINDCVTSNDTERFRQIQHRVWQEQGRPPPLPSPGVNMAGCSSSPAAVGSSSSHASPAKPGASQPGSSQAGFGLQNGYKLPTISSNDLRFHTSPFWDTRNRVGEVKTCEAMAQHRHSISISIRVQDHTVLNQCLNDKSMRIFVFCAGDIRGLQDISFPHQSELKINGGDVKANLRGLKNKPGSTLPVDITDLVRLRPAAYLNNIEFTYALTTKPYYLAIYLCRTTSVEVLASRIGKKIPRASVIQEITRKAQDSDIVTTSQVLSLRCPLTYSRLKLPCRSTTCSHIQCFDAANYLMLQKQGPTWTCPICHKPAPYDTLAMDEYVRDILDNTNEDLDQVTIDEEGRWASHEAKPANNAHRPVAKREPSLVDEDEDFLVVESNRVSYGQDHLATPSRSVQSTATPTTAVSRESSQMPRPATSNKRPAAQVIDLTLSDDDDDELPARPAKRPNYGPNGYSHY